jgi:hypothetical protein
MEYTSPEHAAPPVDGYILQAPVCDADAIALLMGQSVLEESLALANQLIEAGKDYECMPPRHLPEFIRGSPVSPRRWYALAAAELV